jgi:DmsE family decaheme c-type cytochrome
VKNLSGIEVELGRIVGSSRGAPKKTKISKKFVLIAASALIYSAALGFTQSVQAEGTLTVADINSALRGVPQAVNSEQSSQPDRQYAGDRAFSALTAFAQQIGAQQPKSASVKPASSKTAVDSDRQVDDQALAALRDFAQRIGAAQPESIEALPKLAEAESLLEFLQGGSSQSSPASKKDGPVAGGKSSSATVDATIVGEKVCVTCHSSHAEEFGKTLMGRVGKTQPGRFACENCHGPGSAHVKAGGGRGVGGIISFRPNDLSRTAEENNAICLGCHQRGDRTNWAGSIHETRGLMCTNCHTIMKAVSRKRQLKTAFQPDTCFQCHKDRRAQMFRSSHMPIREGKVVCTDCHNPHGSFTESLLKKDSINDTCYTCHAEKRGPFLFEHLPVRENCLNCHDPHGTVNEFSLKFTRPRLCFECHTPGHSQSTGINATTTMGRACANCHTQVHGTNSPAGGALQR